MRDATLKKPTKSGEAAVPFQVGEKLEYRVVYAGSVNAATAEMEVAERRSFHTRHSWHFRVIARTVDVGRMLYELDDQFDSYTDTVTLRSLRYEIYLLEQGKKQDGGATLTTDGEPLNGSGPFVKVLPGTRDPVGVLYYLRTVDWERSKEVVTPVYDGKKLYQIKALPVGANEQLQLPAGNYLAQRIEIRTYHRSRELTEMRFSLWLAMDDQRTPVLMEAELPFGKLRVELRKVSFGRAPIRQ